MIIVLPFLRAHALLVRDRVVVRTSCCSASLLDAGDRLPERVHLRRLGSASGHIPVVYPFDTTNLF